MSSAGSSIWSINSYRMDVMYEFANPYRIDLTPYLLSYVGLKACFQVEISTELLVPWGESELALVPVQQAALRVDVDAEVTLRELGYRVGFCAVVDFSRDRFVFELDRKFLVDLVYYREGVVHRRALQEHLYWQLP